MENNGVSRYRALARKKLKGNWGRGIAAWAVPALFVILVMLVVKFIIRGGIRAAMYGAEQQRILTFLTGISAIIRIATNLFSQIVNYGITGTFYRWYQGREDASATAGFNLAMVNVWGLLKIAFFQLLLLFLWSLLLIIPGIIKFFSYSQAVYIYFDKLNSGQSASQISALECITESRRMMDGKKGELFTLDLSFIGWIAIPFIVTFIITWTYFRSTTGDMSGFFYSGLAVLFFIIFFCMVGIFLFGIPWLWLRTYITMSGAAFHDELIGTKPVQFDAENNILKRFDQTVVYPDGPVKNS